MAFVLACTCIALLATGTFVPVREYAAAVRRASEIRPEYAFEKAIEAHARAKRARLPAPELLQNAEWRPLEPAWPPRFVPIWRVQTAPARSLIPYVHVERIHWLLLAAEIAPVLVLSGGFLTLVARRKRRGKARGTPG